ncbi:hypothetical protein BDM02DRAFT_3259303, partial [Thelephora ganbajun]
MLDIREIQAIQRELNGVTKIVNGITQRFQQRLNHAASTASTLDALQDRIVQLEKEIDKLKSDNDQLKVLKERAVADAEALKRGHHVQRQKIEQIAEERDGALQRLEKLEVTFRGCFSEDRPGSSVGVRTPERSNISVHEERARTKSPVEERERRISIHSSKGGSVRSRSPSVMSTVSEHLAKQRSRRSIGGSSVAGSTIVGSTLTGSTASRPSSTPPRPQSRETSRPASRATSRAKTTEPEGSDLSPSDIPGTRDWYLEMKDPPQTATYARGPFESVDLVERLGLNNGEVFKLEETMIVPKKLGPRIHIHKDMIFLYDPFWLEREDGTYLIDWAEREDVDKIKKYLKGKENPATVFQLFSFPVHRRGWVWNGAHQFRVAEGLPALWPQLRQKA